MQFKYRKDCKLFISITCPLKEASNWLKTFTLLNIMRQSIGNTNRFKVFSIRMRFWKNHTNLIDYK